nr:PREDICTED: glucan endo-1,3-beta-glucosidase 1-like [Daucus carota subsp. sativus]
MANSSFYFLGFLVCLFVCSSCQASVSNGRKLQGKTWCVAQTAAPDDKLQAFLIATCERYNCKAIMPGGPCYQPANIHNHASYALDIAYRGTGVCNPDVGTPTITDPSFGSCHYP